MMQKGVLLPLLHLLSYRAQFERVCHSFQIEKHLFPQLLSGCVLVWTKSDCVGLGRDAERWVYLDHGISLGQLGWWRFTDVDILIPNALWILPRNEASDTGKYTWSKNSTSPLLAPITL